MILEQREFLKEVEDGTARLKQLNYNELVEEVNKDLKYIQEMNNPLVLKQEKDQMIKQEELRKEKVLENVKKFVWPMYFIGFTCYAMFVVAYIGQQRRIEKNQARIDREDNIKSYSCHFMYGLFPVSLFFSTCFINSQSLALFSSIFSLDNTCLRLASSCCQLNSNARSGD